MPKKATLQFGKESSAGTGFTPAGITGLHGCPPEIVIREVIQNSMDAALVSAKRQTAHVLFVAESIPTDKVPGIDKHEEALKRAITSNKKNGKLPDHAENIANTMQECLSKEECQLLHILDNGTGLDEDRMKALLKDGSSVKDEGSTGAFGNGHMAIIATSDLRYVLYGGIRANGWRIASGQAIIAAHKTDNGKTASGSGFLVKKLTGDFDRPYEFATKGEEPPIIKAQLDLIQRRWKSGTSVSVIGFNHFRESKKPLAKTILTAAAKNFFAAIHERQLTVEVQENGRIQKLDSSNVGKYLEKVKDDQRAKRGTKGLISGSRAWESLQTLGKGKKDKIKTKAGIARVALRTGTQSGQRIELCRNGMWITGKISALQDKFTDHEPFHALLLIESSPQEGRVIHDLVREAEGPQHNELLARNMKKENQKELQAALQEIAEWFSNEIERLDPESYAPDDILAIDEYGIESGGSKPGFAGKPTIIRRRPKPRGGKMKKTRKDDDKGASLKTRQYDPNPTQFEAESAQTGLRSCRIQISPQEDYEKSRIRILLDENLDPTCEGRDNESYLIFEKAKLGGKPVPQSQMEMNEDGNPVGILLGNIQAGQTHLVEAEFSTPKEMSIPEERPVVIQIQLLGNKSKDSKGKEATT